MADDIRRQYSAAISSKVQGLLTKASLQAASKIANRVLEDDIRKQANTGKDINDASFPAYTAGYRKQKAKMISTGKYGKKSLKKTRFAATRVDDKTRLSGKTHEDVVVRTKRVNVADGFPDIEIEVDASTPRSKKVVGYLRANGYDFLGVAKASTSAGRQQRDNYKKAWLKALKATSGGKLTINEI